MLILLTLLYASLLCVAFFSPHTVEQQAQQFITQKLTQKTHERIDKIASSKFMNLTKKHMAKEKLKLEKYKQLLHQKVDEKLAKVLAKITDLKMKSQKKYQIFFHKHLEKKITLLSNGIKKLEAFLSQGYIKIMQRLLGDIKIFLSSNVILLFLVTLLFFLKPQHSKILTVIASFMMVSTLICSYFYIFEQNWFFSLIFNDFVGYGYLAYVGVLFSFLVDIELNRARVVYFLLRVFSAV